MMIGSNAFDAHNQTFKLRDGRTLGFAEYGVPTGKALFYFGTTRLDAGFFALPAEKAGIRLIGIDRPGIGLSQFQSNRCLLDWSNDVVDLANLLQINRFAVIGVSGGGPYALVCAYNIPDRLTTCGVVSSVGPITISFYQRWPWLLTPMMWFMSYFFRNEKQAKKSILRFTRQWPKPDRDCLLNPEINNTLAASMVEAFHQGSIGFSYDTLLGQGRPWGFQLEEIEFPRIHLWHGELDHDVPIAMGRTIVERLAKCEENFFPEEGHVSVLANHRYEIMSALMSQI